MSLKEDVVAAVKKTGVLPCIKLHEKGDWLRYAKAMYNGGARVIEVTMTTPGVIEAIEAISNEYKDIDDRLYVAAGTVLDAVSAREVIIHGGTVLVNPCVIPEVDLIPSGGINLTNAADFIKCGACAVSGARTFMDIEKIKQYGIEWITRQVSSFISVIAEAKKTHLIIP